MKATWILGCLLLVMGCGGDSTRSDGGAADATPDATGDTGVDGTAPIGEACPEYDPAGMMHSIYDHRVQRATSTDGVSFMADDRILLEHASVPDAILRPDGSVWVYFVNGNPGQHAIFIAERQPDGTLETIDCVRLDGAINGNAVDPDIVLLPDGRYRLYYFQGWFVEGGPPPPDQPHPMYSAISDDGVHFTVEGVGLSLDGGGTDPTVARWDDDTWLMTVTHPDGVLLATSPDGVAFTLTGQTFDQGISELWRFEDRVRLYVTGMSGFQIHESTDGGEEWSELSSMVRILGADPSMLRETDGTYTLYVKTFSMAPGMPMPPGDG